MFSKDVECGSAKARLALPANMQFFAILSSHSYHTRSGDPAICCSGDVSDGGWPRQGSNEYEDVRSHLESEIWLQGLMNIGETDFYRKEQNNRRFCFEVLGRLRPNPRRSSLQDYAAACS